jgi:cell division septal protein FtsQ
MSPKRDLSRSDAARQRRANRTVKELEQTTKRALKPVNPTVTRSPRRTNAAVPPRRVENLRRFNVALGTPGVSVRSRPAFNLPMLFSNRQLYSLAIVFVLGLAIYLVLSLPFFHVPSVTVLGNARLTREEITTVTGVIGQSIFTVQPQDVEFRLRMNYPELSLVQVQTYMPNHVYVTIEERAPVILWQQGDSYTWIDAQGVAFRPRGSADGLVQVIGLGNPPLGTDVAADSSAPPPFMQRELVNAILALAPNVPAGSTMFFDPKDGLGWKDSRGWNAVFGTSIKDIPLKVRVYQSLVDSLMNQGKTPSIINVAYPDAPFYRSAETQAEDVTSDNGN